MAYGFDKSASFGRFFPDGEFHGFQDYLNERFQEMLAKGQTEQKFFNEFRWALVDAMHSGTDFMAQDLLPRLYTLAKPYKSLGDLINLSAGIAVSSRLRDLIVKLEPGRHQIWPVEIVLPSVEAYPVDYFMLRVLSQLDAFDKANSDQGCWKKSVRILKIAPPQGRSRAWNRLVARRYRGPPYLAWVCLGRVGHCGIRFLCFRHIESRDRRRWPQNATVL
ncbi:imm11 family protein [Pseudorhodobacter ferrugineus]|uniref:imm11 family protein n=1 Tax=Pseudorhodobacter ferrugineus TaxID=77008 RepID=UPI0003B6A294|nr:DUF1629 domain-containing protein [Pseudorhodobacter ferrugineus]